MHKFLLAVCLSGWGAFCVSGQKSRISMRTVYNIPERLHKAPDVGALQYYPCSEFAPSQTVFNVPYEPGKMEPESNCDMLTNVFLAPIREEHYRLRCKYADPVGGEINPILNTGVAEQEYGVPLGATIVSRKGCSNLFFGQTPGSRMYPPEVNLSGGCFDAQKRSNPRKLEGEVSVESILSSDEGSESVDAPKSDDVEAASTSTDSDEDNEPTKDSESGIVTAEGVGGFDYFLECSCSCEVEIPTTPVYRQEEFPQESDNRHYLSTDHDLERPYPDDRSYHVNREQPHSPAFPMRDIGYEPPIHSPHHGRQHHMPPHQPQSVGYGNSYGNHRENYHGEPQHNYHKGNQYAPPQYGNPHPPPQYAPQYAPHGGRRPQHGGYASY
eukprot:Selendium_serpulae@DN3343_c0_g1_i2.p1